MINAETHALDLIVNVIKSGNDTRANEAIQPGHSLLCAAHHNYNDPAMRYLMSEVQTLTGYSLRFFALDDVPGQAAKAGACVAFVVTPSHTPLTVLNRVHSNLITAYVVVSTYAVHIQQR